MKFSRALGGILCLIKSASAYVPTNKDQFHATKDNIGKTMWLFGQSGVFIFSPDGKKQKSYVNSEALCGKKEDYDGPAHFYCRFSSVMSDGKKYVWAAVNRGTPTIDLFDINTGSVVGSFETCKGANKLEYHPLRDEVWVRCSDMVVNGTEETFLDVFAASNPSGEIQTNILMQERALSEGMTSNGYSVIDNTLGDVGYLTDSELPYLYKVNLSSKKIIDKFGINPDSNGLYEAVYSPINKHVFMRAQHCCTCGIEGAAVSECKKGKDVVSPDEMDLVIPTTGPFKGESMPGYCGSKCEGVAGIDTVGVYEFDTVSETVVATHMMAEGIGGDPYPSPDGKYIILLGKNGGKTIRIIEAGEQGLKSRTLVDVELDFERSGYENKSVSKDFAFMYRDGKTSIVFPSGTSHKIAIVDIPEGAVSSSKDLNIRYITFNFDEFTRGRAPHGLYRRIEWAVGTDYVWVTDSTLDYIYVVNTVTGDTLTMQEMDISTIISVENYDRSTMIEMQEQMILDMQPKGVSSAEVAAIVIGCLAIVAGIANYMAMMKVRKDFQAEIARNPRLIGKDIAPENASEQGMNSIN